MRKERRGGGGEVVEEKKWWRRGRKIMYEKCYNFTMFNFHSKQNKNILT